ncbi:GNAT family N-acetyltransferase [Phenylobacterium sp.]|uniref:GNAT family N-acetyltransferase n=1 Tax=Phenylobacterium sp. TaxID=1871053 RepID=UPI00286BD718|nr:GNAT family N-acetyltransferase [Phenylobacterium sp.]
MSVMVRIAGPSDAPAAIAMDAVAGRAPQRRDWILRAFAGEKDRVARLALMDGEPAGFIVVGEFLSFPFVDLIVTAEHARRRGVASALMAAFEGAHAGQKLFVSTNVSNARMRALLVARGYVLSGQVDNVDPGDPELFFARLPAL